MITTMGVKVREKVAGSGVFWIFVYGEGKRKTYRIGAEDQANTIADDIKKEIRQGVFRWDKRSARATPKLVNYYHRFLDDHVKASCRQSTADSYEWAFDHHILPELGNLPLHEITRAKIKMLARRLREKALSKSSIRIVFASLGKLFTEAIEDGIVAVNPASRPGRLYKEAKNVHDEIFPLSATEIVLLLDKIRELFPYWYPLFLCAIHAGLRDSELAGLQWGDVDFSRMVLVIRRNYYAGRIGKTKTGRIRLVEMSETLADELRNLKAQRSHEFNLPIPEWVFCNQVGGPVEMSNVKARYYVPSLEAAEIARRRFHDLRHTFASFHLQAGHSLKWVSEQMGHSSIRVTADVYGHLQPSSDRKAINSMPAPAAEQKGLKVVK